jgi:hypothetical protein
MKRIMTALGAAGLLTGTALTASANSDVAEIAQEFARAARPAWNEIVRERRSYRPERFGNDELPFASREWWQEVERDQRGRRR